MVDVSRRETDEAALYKQLGDASLRVALFELAEEEIDALERDGAAYAPGAHADARVLGAIRRATSKRRSAHRVKRALPRVVTSAACVVLVLFAGLTTAIAMSPAVREQVLGLLIRFDKGHGYTELSLAPMDERAASPVPEGWAGKYFPAYIPQGYELKEVSDVLDEALYIHRRDGRILEFSEHGDGTGVSITSEDAEVKYVTVHGQVAVLSLEPASSFISWSEGDRFFIIYIQNDDEQLLRRMADSVRLVDAAD